MQRLTELLAATSCALQTPAETLNPITHGEQLRDPHPKLTPDSIVIHCPADAGGLAPSLSNYLDTVAPYYGYTVAGSYIGAIILQPETN